MNEYDPPTRCGVYYVPVFLPLHEARALAVYLRRACFTNLDFYLMQPKDIEYLRSAFDTIYQNVTEQIGPVLEG